MRKRDLYINDDEICEDGQSFRVPLLLCDTARFEPRPLSRLSDLSTADLDRHRPGYRLSDGEASKSTNLTDLDAARDAAQAARDRWIADMCSAWKRPPTHDASEPDAAEQLLRPAPHDDPVAAMRSHLRTERADESQRRRDAAWNSYKDQLSRAWQQGRANPREADRIERQGERWRHGR